MIHLFENNIFIVWQPFFPSVNIKYQKKSYFDTEMNVSDILISSPVELLWLENTIFTYWELNPNHIYFKTLMRDNLAAIFSTLSLCLAFI